jgi:hypothetical protein
VPQLNKAGTILGLAVGEMSHMVVISQSSKSMQTKKCGFLGLTIGGIASDRWVASLDGRSFLHKIGPLYISDKGHPNKTA